MSRQIDASDKALSDYVEIKSLLEKVEKILPRLGDNEREIYEEMQNRFATFTTAQFEDKTLLEVMLRNVTVRQELMDQHRDNKG